MRHICYSATVLTQGIRGAELDERTIELIATRVITALRGELGAIAADLAGAPAPSEHLTVGQVAERLGLARSTVYAHWRELGGYKLGQGERAPIRFDSAKLRPTKPSSPAHAPRIDAAPAPAPRRRKRHDLLADAPRLAQALDEVC